MRFRFGELAMPSQRFFAGFWGLVRFEPVAQMGGGGGGNSTSGPGGLKTGHAELMP